MIRKKDVPFLAIAVLVIGFLVYLSQTGHERFISRIPPHIAAIDIVEREKADAYCFSCHDPASPRDDAPPMPPPIIAKDNGTAPPQYAGERRHPIRTKNCRQCHRLQRKK